MSMKRNRSASLSAMRTPLAKHLQVALVQPRPVEYPVLDPDAERTRYWAPPFQVNNLNFGLTSKIIGYTGEFRYATPWWTLLGKYFRGSDLRFYFSGLGQDIFFDGPAEQLMTVLAQLPEVRQHDAARTVPILVELRKLHPMYANVLIADRDGTVWASAIPVAGPFNVADRRYFRNALASGHLLGVPHAVQALGQVRLVRQDDGGRGDVLLHLAGQPGQFFMFLQKSGFMVQ